MSHTHRRAFMQEVGEGMLAVLAGSTLASQLGLAADDPREDKAKPAPLGRLADLLQQTPPAKLLSLLADELRKGTTLRHLVAGGAMANARAFGGQDYNGYHAFMAMAPSFGMASALSGKEKAVPVLKVLYRNSTFIHGTKCHDADKLANPKAIELKKGVPAAQQLREASREGKVELAESIFAAMKGGKPQDDYEAILPLVQDDLNVHRVVLAWRSWETLDFTGMAHARSLLRQTVRFCAHERHGGGDGHPIKGVLTRLFDNHKLLEKKPGTKKAEDAWINKLARTIHLGTRDKAAEQVAAALAEGIRPADIGEAISLASTYLVLHDPGRKDPASEAKPAGSVHGDSVGVHASDAANAWRHIAAVSSPRNTFASLIAAAYHTAGQAERKLDKPYPLAEEIEKVEGKDAETLLSALDEAIKGKDQKRAAAVAARYGTLGLEPRDMVERLRAHTIEADGALHAEKYYNTAIEEYDRGRGAFRWLHIVALARVTASAAGRPAPGLTEARKLLGA